MVAYRNGMIIVSTSGEVLNRFYRVSEFPSGELNIEIKKSLLLDYPVVYDFHLSPEEFDGRKPFHDRWLEELLLLVSMVKDHYGTALVFGRLFLPYFPYSRADRVIQNGSWIQGNQFLTIHRLLSGFFREIVTFDLHNPDFVHYGMTKIQNIEEGLPPSSEKMIFIFPDTGSTRRKLFLEVKKARLPYLLLEKVRSQDGLSSSLVSVMNLPPSLEGFRGVLVDDICDGGRTFIEAAKAIRGDSRFSELPLELHVTHGIFSKGLEELRKYYNVIKCMIEF